MQKRLARRSALVLTTAVTAAGFFAPVGMALPIAGPAGDDSSDLDLLWNPQTLRAEDPSNNRLAESIGTPQRTTTISFERDNNGNVVERTVSHERRDSAGNMRPLRWSASSKQVTLTWPQNPDVSQWHVSVGNTSSSTQTGTSFVYRTRSTKAQTYTIDGTKKQVVNGKRVTSPVTYSVTVPAYDSSSLGKPVTTATKSLQRNQDVAAGTEKTRYFQWLSFIPQHHIDAPLLCKAQNTSVKYFSGDNRGFLDNSLDPDMYDSSWKTRARVSARVGSSWDKSQAPDWLNGWIDKQVGTSHGYDSNLKMIESKNAGTSGIKLTDSGVNPTTSLSYRNVNSSVALPLCSGAPAISWNFFYTARNDGWISVTGEFDQAPSTELLWESTTNSQDSNAYKYGCWYRFNNKGFEKLAPIFPNAEVDLDANPDIARPSCIEK